MITKYENLRNIAVVISQLSEEELIEFFADNFEQKELVFISDVLKETIRI